jgi:hypothetical protein
MTSRGPGPDGNDVAASPAGGGDRVVVGVLVARVWVEQGKLRARISSTADVERAVERVRTTSDRAVLIRAMEELIEQIAGPADPDEPE